jgi:hypothetical protein
MKTIIMLLLLLNLTHADTLKDVEKRMKRCLVLSEKMKDPFLKKVWTDRADIEYSTILFEKKHYKKKVRTNNELSK